MIIKLQVEHCRLRVFHNLQRDRIPTCNFRPATFNRCAAFTIVEIAISLAVIGIALVGIIGILPYGMRVQKDNREQTVINQDATVFLQAVRGGARGLDDLTNYVYAVTNYWGKYQSKGRGLSSAGNGVNGYDNFFATVASGYFTLDGKPLTNGANIVGLLTTPEYVRAADGFPISQAEFLNSGGISNHIVAYVRSISGPAVEKPPQTPDSLVRQDSFSYKILCVNAPVAVNTNIFFQTSYTTNLTANLHELRLAFLWPILPNGNLGTGRQAFRVTVPGQIAQDTNNSSLYFFQSQSFTNEP